MTIEEVKNVSSYSSSSSVEVRGATPPKPART